MFRGTVYVQRASLASWPQWDAFFQSKTCFFFVTLIILSMGAYDPLIEKNNLSTTQWGALTTRRQWVRRLKSQLALF